MLKKHLSNANHQLLVGIHRIENKEKLKFDIKNKQKFKSKYEINKEKENKNKSKFTLDDFDDFVANNLERMKRIKNG
jgi:hypothetical protein